jgi:hypothetical protein
MTINEMYEKRIVELLHRVQTLELMVASLHASRVNDDECSVYPKSMLTYWKGKDLAEQLVDAIAANDGCSLCWMEE